MWSVRAKYLRRPAHPLVFLVILVSCLVGPPMAVEAVGTPSEIVLLAGESKVITGAEVSRVAVGQPNVADVRVLAPTEVLVNGKAEGQTTLLLWTASGGVSETNIRVLRARAPLTNREVADLIGQPQAEVRDLAGYLVVEGKITGSQRERISRLGAVLGSQLVDLTEMLPEPPNPVAEAEPVLPAPAITPPPPEEPGPDDLQTLLNQVVGPGIGVEQRHGRTVLSGRFQSEAAHRRALELARDFFKQPLVDASSVEVPSRLFQIKARLIEVDRQASRELGLEWPVSLALGEPTGPDGVPSGGWTRLEPLLVKVKALEESGRARMLAEPSMTVTDGVEGAFLAGGQIPVPLESEGRVTIEWKEYGIRLRVKPTLLSSGLVRLEARPEVSSLDWANGVRSAGSTVPALKTRWAETIIEQRSGDTLVLAGLSLSEQSEHDGRLPGLADLPVLGALARSGRGALRQTELTILLTTTLQTTIPPTPESSEPVPPALAERPTGQPQREGGAKHEP